MTTTILAGDTAAMSAAETAIAAAVDAAVKGRRYTLGELAEADPQELLRDAVSRVGYPLDLHGRKLLCVHVAWVISRAAWDCRSGPNDHLGGAA